MNFSKLFQLVRLIQDKNTTYQSLIHFLHGEAPPADHNFLAKVNLSDISILIKSEAYKKEDALFLGNERPHATVGFIIENPFHYYIYKNIYKHLPESEFILDVPWIQDNMPNWVEFFSKIKVFLESEKVYFRMVRPGEDERTFLKKYKVLVYNTMGHKYITGDYFRGKKARVMYGNSKDSYNFGPWSRYYDLALTYGPYSHELMSTFTTSVVVGNPRFDEWFSGTLPLQKPEASLKGKIDKNKKTILYLPTHGNLCSLEYFGNHVQEIASEFNLIIRPHFATLHWEQERLESLKKAAGPHKESIVWVDDYTDLVELLAISDLVISDNSGAIFDAVFADKPVVLIDLWKDDFFKIKMWEPRKYSRNMSVLPLTYPGSIEQRIKREPNLRIGEVVDSQSAPLLEAITTTFDNDAVFRVSRERLNKMLFDFRDGKSGERAAGELRTLAGHKAATANEGRANEFLRYSVAEGIHTSVLWHQNQLDLFQAILYEYCTSPHLMEGKKVQSPIFYSVIIPTYNGSGRIQLALDAIIAQEGIRDDSYEIIIVDDGSERMVNNIVCEYMRRYPDKKITYVWYKQNGGPAFARNIGITLSRGRFTCFTDDDCIVPADWITSFQQAFLKNPEVSGVGGWYVPVARKDGKKTGLLDRFVLWMHAPDIFSSHKSTWHWNNKVGNTGNVCYRKIALEKLGGFNAYFRYPSLEDWELKIRFHEGMYSLLQIPMMVMHTKHFSFRVFVKHWALRGWASYLIVLLHPLYQQFDVNSFSRATLLTLQNSLQMWAKRHSKLPSKFSYLPYSYLFIFLIPFQYFILLVGRYWVTLGILTQKQNHQ